MLSLAGLAAAIPFIRPLVWPKRLTELLSEKPTELPPGFQAEDPKDQVNGWPRVLVHQDTGARLIRIEGGTFTPGNVSDAAEDEPHDRKSASSIILPDFYMQETEVTNAMMETYFRARKLAPEDRPPRWRKVCQWLEKQVADIGPYPAVGIPHDMAEAFARWMGGRLPREAEWEYAARSRGERRRYVWRNELKPSRKLANIDSVDEYPTKFLPPKFFPSDQTEQGIYDLFGNVKEWCLEPYHDLTEQPTHRSQDAASSEPGRSGRHVIRGGSFLSWSDRVSTTGPRFPEASELTAKELAEDGSASDLGFRVVVEWPRRRRP
ncbi:MAG: SUMF1/EgtB/PvdO family nonheme iron enzyme [Isosphaeraceae bacterium]|nr:SUMF1/EgtB/PvdO family nonheme iron enzyme [Isosphaeraceae bacterium]